MLCCCIKMQIRWFGKVWCSSINDQRLGYSILSVKLSKAIIKYNVWVDNADTSQTSRSMVPLGHRCRSLNTLCTQCALKAFTRVLHVEEQEWRDARFGVWMKQPWYERKKKSGWSELKCCAVLLLVNTLVDIVASIAEEGKHKKKVICGTDRQWSIIGHVAWDQILFCLPSASPSLPLNLQF